MNNKELKQSYANMRMKTDLSLSMLAADASMKIEELLKGKSPDYIQGFKDGTKMWNEMNIAHNETQHQAMIEFIEKFNKEWNKK